MRRNLLSGDRAHAPHSNGGQMPACDLHCFRHGRKFWHLLTVFFTGDHLHGNRDGTLRRAKHKLLHDNIEHWA